MTGIWYVTHPPFVFSSLTPSSVKQIEKAEREARVADRRASKYAAELAAIQEHAAELEQSQSSALESQTESQLPSVLVTQRILYTIPELSEATICFLTNTKVCSFLEFTAFPHLDSAFQTTDVNDILAPISPNRRFLEPVSPFAELLPSPTPASNVALPTFDNLPLPSRARSDSPPVRTLSPAFEDLDTQTFEPDQYGLHSIHGPLTTYVCPSFLMIFLPLINLNGSFLQYLL